jgi:protocatechuate 3,4-dioxygenase beta subunit
MVPLAEGLIWLVFSSGLVSLPEISAPAPALRTFLVDKAPADPEPDPAALIRAAHGASAAPPSGNSRLHTTVGVGYVQHADWGTEALVSGSVAGLDVQADSLFTFGPQGALFDHGTIAVRRPDQHWLAEGGDLFSDLRGPATGARLSWQVTDRWRPSLAFYGPPRHAINTNSVMAYRDRLELGAVTFDGEVATDASYFVRGRVTARQRLAIESSYRRMRLPEAVGDAGVQAEVRVWRGLALTGGLFRSNRAGEQSSWQTFGVRVPLHRAIGLTIERTFTTSGMTNSTASAVMVDAHSNQLMFLQRYEWGDSRARQAGLLSVSRDQLHSMASYTVGPRLNVALRVATQWQESGPSQNWLEAQGTMRITRQTLLQITAPVPQPLDVDRVRVVLEQGLPRQFSVLAEYGRPSAYQDIQFGADPPRFRLMLRRSFDVATPSPSGAVSGSVVDYVGRPVPGARVRLGAFTADSDADGRYVFARVPPGEFDLSLDTDFLPADYAWDGRSRHLTIKASSRVVNDLVVAPLNAIHGRVFVDRDNNGRFDRGEGVPGAVLHLGDHVTATDIDGAYDFYNVLPGTHDVELDADRMPAGFDAGSHTKLTIELREDRPATGVDFLVTAKAKTVIWRSAK